MGYKNTVLVTGGAGFIGSAFLRILVPKHPDWYFINLDALTYAGDLKKVEAISESPNYTFVHGNICDRSLVEKLFEEYPINWVVNFAAESHVDNSIKDSTAFIQTNVAGTHVLLDVAKLAWGLDGLTKPDNKYRFLQVSTDEVYGSLGPTDKSWVEEDPLLPNSPYAASKAASEHLVRSYYKTYGLPILITRSSNNFGPYQNNEKLVPKVIDAAIKNKPISIYGNGENIRDWIYVDQNIASVLNVIQKGIVGETYNIGGDNERSNLDIANQIISFIPKSKSKIQLVKDRLGHDFRYSINSSKLQSLSNKIEVDFVYYLKQTIDFYLGYSHEYHN
jgi:dTDP-glucose 4,6-dehydratase